METNATKGDSFRIGGYVIAECRGPDGKLKWRDEGPNLIVDEGIDFIMDVALSGGAADTSLFIGLKDTGTPLVGWTMASGPTEITPYSEGTRQAWTEAGVSAKVITNSASPAVFSINATDTVFGAFLNTDASGTAGTLIGAKDFTGGSQAVADGDTLSVTYQITGSSS